MNIHHIDNIFDEMIDDVRFIKISIRFIGKKWGS